MRGRGPARLVRGHGRGALAVTLAGELLGTALARFGDGSGGFYDTADDGEALVYRPADPTDGPTPSGTFAVAGALLSYSALTGSMEHREAAAAALGVLGPIAGQFPRAAGSGLAVAEALISGPAEIAIVGPAATRARRRCTWRRCVRRRRAPSWPWATAGQGITGRTGRSRCWRAAAWSAGPRRLTSAAASPASPR